MILNHSDIRKGEVTRTTKISRGPSSGDFETLNLGFYVYGHCIDFIVHSGHLNLRFISSNGMRVTPFSWTWPRDTLEWIRIADYKKICQKRKNRF